jgi:hypothetical protein
MVQTNAQPCWIPFHCNTETSGSAGKPIPKCLTHCFQTSKKSCRRGCFLNLRVVCRGDEGRGGGWHGEVLVEFIFTHSLCKASVPVHIEGILVFSMWCCSPAIWAVAVLGGYWWLRGNAGKPSLSYHHTMVLSPLCLLSHCLCICVTLPSLDMSQVLQARKESCGMTEPWSEKWENHPYRLTLTWHSLVIFH